jgi:hypothetical protein
MSIGDREADKRPTKPTQASLNHLPGTTVFNRAEFFIATSKKLV